MVQALSCQPAEHEAAVARLQSERRESARALRAAREELAGMLADHLVATMPTSELVAATGCCSSCGPAAVRPIRKTDRTQT